MNLKHLEKTAGPVGVTLAGTAGFIKNHPFATLGIISAVPIFVVYPEFGKQGKGPASDSNRVKQGKEDGLPDPTSQRDFPKLEKAGSAG